MHIVLIRHCTRIDKSKHGISPGQSEVSLHAGDQNDNKVGAEDYDESSNWLSNFDPPLNESIASLEMESAFKKISNDILSKSRTKQIMIHSSPYNRCIQTSELLLDKIIHGKQNDVEKINTKLRVDQALSEWLNENYNLKYLPPNDDGYSMINNVNAYLNQPSLSASNGAFTETTKNQLRNVKDSTWSYNQLGHCGEYGESASAFTRRCFNYLINLLQYYYTKQGSEVDRQMAVVIISHGAVISTLLQILLGRSIFSEIPLCTPIYFKQSQKRRSVFKLMDYDFNLNKLLGPSTDQEFYKILDSPIDLTKLDPDNLRSELTIGTTGFTTIIQSIPKQIGSPKQSGGKGEPTRRRRNTINIGDKEKDASEDNKIESLKQTRSSRQLYLLNKNTSEEKVIDLDKLHSYFGGDSGSDTNSEDETGADGGRSASFDEFKDLQENGLNKSVYKGSITSLSSFNEENKSKFQLNMKNFFSRPSPIKGDPFSHFFLSRSSTMDDDGSDYDEFNMSRKSSVTNGDDSIRLSAFADNVAAASSISHGLGVFAGDDDAESSGDDSDGSDTRILSFGTRNKLQNMILTERAKEKEKDARARMQADEPTTVLDGTFAKVPLGSNSKLSLAAQGAASASSSTGDIKGSGSGSGADGGQGSKIKLVMPRLISTRNMNLHVRGADGDGDGDGDAGVGGSSAHETEYSAREERQRRRQQQQRRHRPSRGSVSSEDTLKKILLQEDLRLGWPVRSLGADPPAGDDADENDAEEEEEEEETGWFGGFSRR